MIIVNQESFTRAFCVASTDYQRFLAALKLMTSQWVQIARPITGRICPLRAQRVKSSTKHLRSARVNLIRGDLDTTFKYNLPSCHLKRDKYSTPSTM